MQQAIPYSNGRTWMAVSSPCGNRSCNSSNGDNSALESLVKENPVLVAGKRGCCMCHVVRRLLLGLGVNPLVIEIDDDCDEQSLAEELRGVTWEAAVQFPALFIGGRHVGGLDWLMSAHISGDLVPILKQAGALWL